MCLSHLRIWLICVFSLMCLSQLCLSHLRVCLICICLSDACRRQRTLPARTNSPGRWRLRRIAHPARRAAAARSLKGAAAWRRCCRRCTTRRTRDTSSGPSSRSPTTRWEGAAWLECWDFFNLIFVVVSLHYTYALQYKYNAAQYTKQNCYEKSL